MLAKLPLVNGRSRLHASLTSASTLFGGTKKDSSSSNTRNMTWVNTGLLWGTLSLAVGEAAGVMAQRGGRDVPILFQVVVRMFDRP